MDEEVYENLLTLSALDKLKSASQLPEVSQEAFFAIKRQQKLRFLRQELRVHRRTKHLKSYWSAYSRQGRSILSIANDLKFSPCMLARLLLEFHFQCTKKQVSAMIKNTAYIQDLRLRNEIEQCIKNDLDCSPHIDRIRHNIGIEYEYILHRYLHAAKIPFETEDRLRERGMSKTPDALITVPFGVYAPDGTFHTVNWIDSKAMFGDPHTHDVSNLLQLQGYVNRYGPGLVIYWFGYLKKLNKDEDIYLVDDFPRQLCKISDIGIKPIVNSNDECDLPKIPIVGSNAAANLALASYMIQPP